jgi:hypothetical protein
VKVLSTTDAAASTTVLRMEVEDFAQNFDSAPAARRAAVARLGVPQPPLVEQKTFSSSVARRAPMPPAAPAPADATPWPWPQTWLPRRRRCRRQRNDGNHAASRSSRRAGRRSPMSKTSPITRRRCWPTCC